MNEFENYGYSPYGGGWGHIQNNMYNGYGYGSNPYSNWGYQQNQRI